MSPVIHCCVFLVFVTQFISAEPLWTKSQMEYLENMKQDYRQEIDSLRKELELIKKKDGERTKCDDDKQIKALRSTQRMLVGQSQLVAFYAHLSSNTMVNSNHAIAYDIVKTNVGNGYNRLSGQFQAPVAGLYHFTNTVMSQPQHGIHVDIVQNGVSIGKNWADHNGYESGSVSVIVELDEGDLVWVKDSDGGMEHLEHDYNSFSGFLISSVF